MHRRRIDERHLTHTDDTDRVFLTAYMRHDIIEFIGDAEEIRTVDLIDLNTLRDGQMLEVQMTLAVFIRVDLVMECTDMGSLTRTHQEEHQCQ